LDPKNKSQPSQKVGSQINKKDIKKERETVDKKEDNKEDKNLTLLWKHINQVCYHHVG